MSSLYNFYKLSISPNLFPKQSLKERGSSLGPHSHHCHIWSQSHPHPCLLPSCSRTSHPPKLPPLLASVTTLWWDAAPPTPSCCTCAFVAASGRPRTKGLPVDTKCPGGSSHSLKFIGTLAASTGQVCSLGDQQSPVSKAGGTVALRSLVGSRGSGTCSHAPSHPSFPSPECSFCRGHGTISRSSMRCVRCNSEEVPPPSWYSPCTSDHPSAPSAAASGVVEHDTARGPHGHGPAPPAPLL